MTRKRSIILLSLLLGALFGTSEALSALPKELRLTSLHDFAVLLKREKRSVSEWVQQINNKNLDLLCLGESHRSSYREFLAQSILPHLNADKLLLEINAEGMGPLLRSYEQTPQKAELLGAPIAPVLDAYFEQNPRGELAGVDQTTPQKREEYTEQSNVPRSQRVLSRDGYIAANILQEYQSGKRLVALYGSKHCARFDDGLGGAMPFFYHLSVGPLKLPQTHSALVISSRTRDVFTALLMFMGLDQETFVIPDTSKIPPRVYNNKWEIFTLFHNYDSIIYFKD